MWLLAKLLSESFSNGGIFSKRDRAQFSDTAIGSGHRTSPIDFEPTSIEIASERRLTKASGRAKLADPLASSGIIGRSENMAGFHLIIYGRL
jgi:hypothetical protein